MGGAGMKREALNFDRPTSLEATAPPEVRGLERDEVRLIVSTPAGHTHVRFRDLSKFLDPGDVLVVNRSATVPASLPAKGDTGEFLLNLSTRYGDGLWLAELRWSPSEPGPLPLEAGAEIRVAGLPARLIAPYPGLPRLWFVRIAGNLKTAVACFGQPIRYAYLDQAYPIEYYQTLFGNIPGSAEMPSAGRPFSQQVMEDLQAWRVRVAGIVLHAGVSSLEVEADDVEDQPLYPEPFAVPPATARTVNRAHRAGRRIIAVGTTVVRALESAWDGEQVQPLEGFTRLYVHPDRKVNVVDGLLTGLHDPLASHLAMLYAIAGPELICEAYAEAVREGYLWHEFGDSHLILPA